MPTALVLTVGTTADPLLGAVEQQHEQDPRLVVYLLYGRPFPGQDPSPFDVAVQVKDRAGKLGLRAEVREIPDPEDVDECLRVCREVLREAEGYDRVVVDFTGGTKAMSAAVAHAALTAPLSGQLVFEYTGGKVRDQHGRVLREAMRRRVTERTATEELVRQVLELLPKFAYREALALVRRLPQAGRAGFVGQAVAALSAWDEFDYGAARELLQKQYGAARAVQDAAELAPLAGLILRLLEPANRMVDALRRVQVLQEGSLRDWPDPEAMSLLVADALENASRRLAEGRPTDTVLRAYRAVEMAVQTRLVARRVSPWNPDWQALGEDVVRRYVARLKGSSAPSGQVGEEREAPPGTVETVPLPRELALTTGLRLVEVLDRPLPDRLADHLQDLQHTRNRSYLEHGYKRVRGEDGFRLLAYADEICAFVLQADVRALRKRVTHHVWG